MKPWETLTMSRREGPRIGLLKALVTGRAIGREGRGSSIPGPMEPGEAGDARASGRAGAEGEGDADRIADGVQNRRVVDPKVATVQDELTSDHQGDLGELNLHRRYDLPRHPVQGEVPGDHGLSSRHLDALAFEPDRREARHVEEIRAAQMLVPHADARVDGD